MYFDIFYIYIYIYIYKVMFYHMVCYDFFKILLPFLIRLYNERCLRAFLRPS